uniref:60S ribosome subunit biogenesis protein NIP7 homolog n=1 Tax=Sinocyclocheilus grahami TaxID=75366 RepID=A0A672PKB5_SINGR
MRPLTDEEIKTMFEKLSKYIGENIKLLIDRPDGTYCFRLHNDRFKVWVKPGSEQSFLYGNHIMKSGLGRITENTAQYQGVVVYSMADVPLGFGVAAKTTQECRKVDPMSIVVFHQADIGEYIRSEDTLT